MIEVLFYNKQTQVNFYDIKITLADAPEIDKKINFEPYFENEHDLYIAQYEAAKQGLKLTGVVTKKEVLIDEKDGSTTILVHIKLEEL